MAKSKKKTPEEIKSAQSEYSKAVDQNTGSSGYNAIQTQTSGSGNRMASNALGGSLDNAALINNLSNKNGAINANAQMANINANAKNYAGQQADATAKGAQAQATTAARAAGMNKAQAAMMGAQQNANAFQNAYGNAYGQQLGTANNAYENQTNRLNTNITNQQNLANANQQNQQSLYASLLGANITGLGNKVTMAQQQDSQNYSQGGLFSDERLKHYKECSKKVVVRSPSKIKALKYTPKGE